MSNKLCIQCGTVADVGPGDAALCPGCFSRSSMIPSIVRQPDQGWRADVSEIATADQLIHQAYPTVRMGEPFKSLLHGMGDRDLVMVFGPQGSMKSTAMMAFADDLSHANDWKVLYNCTEEGIGQTVGERLLRLEIRGDKFLVGCKTNLAGLAETIRAEGVSFCVLDSFIAASTSLVQALAAFHQSVNIAIAVITHCNRSGDYAGSSSLAHLADIILHLWQDDGKRWWATEKNRHGDLCRKELALC